MTEQRERIWDVSHLPKWWVWYVFIALPDAAKSFEDEMRQALEILDPKKPKGDGHSHNVYDDLKSVPNDRTGPYGLVVTVYIRPGSCTPADRKGRNKSAKLMRTKLLPNMPSTEPDFGISANTCIRRSSAILSLALERLLSDFFETQIQSRILKRPY
ncbi:hypothetical protein P170DRAFT_424303 [Aspergillus steynii IBT 23096]|uniref:Uncharacterized protein n=1 Tax=Aspergillus steynii IBT 23096 TaxID=1392250 RepID=A0A2I2GL31_9EURO|nr:uncharacterized protein P170DRAFT_424303 [Aspergillus steynii IBT 23096]PLB53585.1 hypothetical protein P170DRAFT_424303 [Aspergillus steynii IBT 23096]